MLARKYIHWFLFNLECARFGLGQYKFKRVPNTGLWFAFLIKLCFISNIDLDSNIVVEGVNRFTTIIIYTTLHRVEQKMVCFGLS